MISLSGVQAKIAGGACHGLVQTPQLALGKPGGSQKVCVYPPQALLLQAMPLHKAENLIMLRDGGPRQGLNQSEHFGAIFEVPASQLSGYERMDQHFALLQQRLQCGVAAPEMLDPHRGVYEDHGRIEPRLRRTRARPFSEPPSRASRRALSRAISASRPKRTKAVFSAIPVNREAFCRSAESMFNVVFICISMYV